MTGTSSLNLTQTIPAESFDQLHASAIGEPSAIRAILQRLLRDGVRMRGARNRSDDAEVAYVFSVGSASLELAVENFDENQRGTVLLNFELDGVPYFFAAARRGLAGGPTLRTGLPSRIYRAERRDRVRHKAGSLRDRAAQVVFVSSSGAATARILDVSADGLRVEGVSRELDSLGDMFRVTFPDPSSAARWAKIRNRVPVPGRVGWSHLGLSTSAVPPSKPHPVERRQAVLPMSRGGRLKRKLGLLVASAEAAIDNALGRANGVDAIRVVEYHNTSGERLRAIVDSVGETRGAPVVVIPPAWGRTKETLQPLAATILATFEKASQPVVVLRFDGVRRRGESYNDPECRDAGRENLNFTISEGVRDIKATIDFLQNSEEFQTKQAILVSFSAASIESRRAVVSDQSGCIRGWVSVVGAPDLQSGLRKVSGGVDYVGGAERGVQFGVQELMGVVTDVDRIAKDALDNGLACLEDARREMAQISVPVTWIHGQYDAWLDLGRVQEIMGCGDPGLRRLLEVPTGHQLRSSQEALEVFQLIALETARIATGREIKPSLPDLSALESRRKAERRRIKEREVDLHAFWQDYLLGRDGGLGIDLMNAIKPYEDLMASQVARLALQAGDRVADIGAGTGVFPLWLAGWRERPSGVLIDEVDFVAEAMECGRERLEKLGVPRDMEVRYLECDLRADSASLEETLPSATYDAVLASLFLSYLPDPERQMQNFFRILRSSGRVVLSTLRRDADVSRLFTEGVRELRSGRAQEAFGEGGEGRVDESLRRFLNDAARVLDFEEQGVFEFWDANELERMARSVGFVRVETEPTFGEPPQGIILSATKP